MVLLRAILQMVRAYLIVTKPILASEAKRDELHNLQLLNIA